MIYGKMLIVAAIATTAMLASCAEYPDRITAAYIPSIIYRGASCGEINQERARLAGYVQQITKEQAAVSGVDTVMLATGLAVFWPAVAILPLTVDQSAQLAVARGHYDALLKAGAEQGCHAPVAAGQAQTAAVMPNWKRYPGDFPPL